MRAFEKDKTLRSLELILKFLGKDGCDVATNEPILFVGGGVLSGIAGLPSSL